MTLGAALDARRPYLLTAAGLVAADQATKAAAHAWLRGAPVVEVVPGFFNLVYSRNRGGLFGYFSDLGDPWRTALLTVFPILAILLLLRFLLADDGTRAPARAGLALILGGATGNLIDRILRGEVVDFLDAYVAAPRLGAWLVDRFGTAHWPTFNVADSAIVVGAGLLLVDALRPTRGHAPSRENPCIRS